MGGRIVIHTLGCSKNTVDSEVLGGALRSSGREVLFEGTTQVGDTLLINTCGFIGDAKEESVDHILRAASLRQRGDLSSLIVFGCLSQRYASELRAEIPEVDGWYGARDLLPLARALGVEDCSPLHRVVSTPSHYAYLKIAEGCDRHCAFCAIPSIRGRYRSRAMEGLVAESRALASHGVRELILIAQELTYYGHDKGDREALVRLLSRLASIDGIDWIRLHYAYPNPFPDELMDWMASEPKACPYLDIPLQHIAEGVLQSMRRNHTGEYARELIRRLRSRIPNLVLRTTLIVGYPTEGEQDFEELLAFVDEGHFDHVGVFTYSEEEGTYAALHYPDSISPEVKEARRSALMQAQMRVSMRRKQGYVGRVLPVIIDSRIDAYTLQGRTQFDAPEVDGEVLVHDLGGEVEVGDLVDVRIDSASEYDLEGTHVGLNKA